MKDTIFYNFGRLVYKLRWLFFLLWVALILACCPFAPDFVKPFKSTGFSVDNSASSKAEHALNEALGFDSNRFIVMYTSKTLHATDPAFEDKIKKSLSGLKEYPIKHEIIYPSDNKKQISADKHTAYVVILFNSKHTITNNLLARLQADIKQPADMSMSVGGEPIFVQGLEKQTQLDLFKADYFAAPLTIIVLVLVFESVVCAFIPLLLGGGCAFIILTTLYFLGHMMKLSIFTINIALMLGICLSLDYALFMINRFRYELINGADTRKAIANTQATAGKAVFFSGLAVFVSLSALLLFPINILFSVGIGGLAAVFMAVGTSMFVLPSLLSILGPRINMFPVRIFKLNKDSSSAFWHWLVTRVIRRPLVYFTMIIVILLALGYPFLQAEFGISDYKILPIHSPVREFFNLYIDKFNPNNLTPIQDVITSDTNIRSKNNISKVYEYTRKIALIPYVDQVDSIVNTEPSLSKAQYQMLYRPSNQHLLNSGAHLLLKTTTTEHMTLITILSKFNENATETRDLINHLLLIKPGDGLTSQLTGEPVKNIDVLDSISQTFPYALLWILAITYIILIILLRSLFLPLKAIITTVLSLCASYGVLVFIFQEGHLSTLLNFQTQGMLDVSLLIIIFCALFGFSMDYEVFLLTRIKEQFEKTGDNEKSIIFGVEHSSRIITSAAVIVIFICLSFMAADVLMIKAFGLGIAIAIFTDAFLIRTLLVPATMTLMGKWNWYLPAWLEKILPHI